MMCARKSPHPRPLSTGGAIALLASFLVLNPIAAPQEVPRRKSLPEMVATPSDVRDTAGLFAAEAVRSAREALQKIEKSTGVATLIETTETLKGENVDEVAIRLARRSGLKGVFILIAR